MIDARRTIDEHGLLADAEPSAEAVAAALEGRFGVATSGPATEERVYYDTFDGLLRARSKTLFWPAEIPFDQGAVNGEIQALVGVRALLPQAKVQLRSETVSLLDELDKTVARVVVAWPTVIVPGSERVPLQPRLWIAGVRGYESETDVAYGLLDSSLGIHRCEQMLHDEAVAAAGGDPAGVRSKPDVSLDPGERADAATARVLAALLGVMDANLPGTLADTDTEFLHDYRVSVRRTRAVLRELRRVFPEAEWLHFRAEFKWLQGATSDTRDLDVYVEGFDELRDLAPLSLQADLEPLRAALEQRREVARHRMVGELRSQRAGGLRSEWAAFLGGLLGHPLEDRPDAARSIEVVSGERIHRLHRRMVKMGGAIGPASPPEDYHELRKVGKELRYMLELFGLPLHDNDVVRPMVRALKRLQDVLGRHQDREVQIQTLRGLGAELASSPGGPGALMATGVLVERLEADAAAARGEFAASFAEFASPAQRELVTETFR